MEDSPISLHDDAGYPPEGSLGAVLDPVGGVAGDMLLGALVDLGADLKEIRRGLAGLEIEPWSLDAQRVARRHLDCLKVEVSYRQSHDHRHLADIQRIVRKANLPEPVLRGVEDTFLKLAQAEALAHGVDVQKVHFHEVGAADAILDVCGVHFAMHLLGLSGFWVTPLPAGRGNAQCAHGELPCPVPATLRLLEGFDLSLGQAQGEMVTPTGAALVASLGRPLREPIGVHRLGTVGYGAGTREGSLCRVWRIDEAPASATQATREPGLDHDEVHAVMHKVGLAPQTLWSLACELDDCDPQALAFLCEQLMQKGALDARTVPTTMKKGRAAQSLEVLVPQDASVLEALARCLVKDSSTLGLRVQEVQRYVAPREFFVAETPWGSVRVKVADFGWHRRAYPEYEECAELARAHAIPFAQVQRAAMLAWEKDA